MSRRIARVLLDSPLPQLDRLLDYALPEELGEVPPGARVRVPLRTAGRVVDAYAVEIGREDDAERALSEVESVVSPVAVLPERLYALARRVADRAAGSAADILRLAIPKRQVRVEKAWSGEAPVPAVEDERLADARAVLARYAGLGDVLAPVEASEADSGTAPAPRAVIEAIPVPGVGAGGLAVPAGLLLLAAAAAETLAVGRSAILVVPDHRDLDLLLAALGRFVPEEAVVRHDARQTGPDRYRAFLRTLAEAPCIVVGNRSAVYAPVRAGLVALWDDGDPLLSEPLAPGVHARDAALIRQEQEGGVLLLAACSRSSDAERLVQTGWMREIRAERRIRPAVQLSTPQELDRRGQRLPSSAFLSARTASAEGPVLVQVARPGFSPTLVCAGCRTPGRCAHCAGPLATTRRGAAPVCGWCGRDARGWRCGSCGGEALRLASSGSERTADELGRAFPGVRVIVADGAHPVARVDARPALVVATRGAEPVAEGGYRAVVLLDGARMLQAPDLRIGESCLRWWSNAAALAAPGAPVHLVGVDGPVARALATWSQSAYAQSELRARAPLHLPPVVRVGRIEGTAGAVDAALDALRALPLPEDAVLGPVPDPEAEGRVRALVRFGYGHGAEVAAALRAAVIAQAVQGRRERAPAGGRRRTPRTALSVRLDVLEPEL